MTKLLQRIGRMRNRKLPQVVNEAIWILTNYARAVENGDSEAKQTWKNKWHNWKSSHPKLARKIEREHLKEEI